MSSKDMGSYGNNKEVSQRSPHPPRPRRPEKVSSKDMGFRLTEFQQDTFALESFQRENKHRKEQKHKNIFRTGVG